MKSFMLAAATMVMTAGAAIGQQIFVAAAGGRVVSADAATLEFSPVGQATELLNGLDAGRDRLFVTSANDQVGIMPMNGSLPPYYVHVPGSDNSAIVVDGQSLLLADQDGTIRRVNPLTGQVLDTLHAPIEIDAMLLDDDTLYIGGPQGSVYRGNKDTGGFVYFACACLGPINALADLGDRIIAGDQNGSHQTYRKTDGQIIGFVWAPGPVTGLALTGSEVLSANAAGQIRRINPITGQISRTVDTGLPIVGMVLSNPPCEADFNADGWISSADFDGFLSEFEAGDISADHDGDGFVTGSDFDPFVVAFERGC